MSANYEKMNGGAKMRNLFSLVPFEREMDRFFDDDFFPVRKFDVMKGMKADIHEKDGNYIIDLDLPGYKKDEVNVDIVDGNLVVNAKHETNKEEKDEKGNLIRSERSFGSCSRSFYVGDGVKAEDVKAKFENGVLNITLPCNDKKAIENKQTISIE